MPKTDHLKKYQFKKGGVSNPEGARSHDKVKRAMKQLTLELYKEVIDLVLMGNLSELKALAENPTTPVIQVGIAVSVMKAIKMGDYTVIEKIAERLVGKIPEQLNVNSVNQTSLMVGALDKPKLRAALEQLQDDV